ncbi:MAG: hypothetical protein KDB16_16365 [Acidimicrobiales bacterium]|nr:hypothetical protein [Acidimicrobiales bacterium]
MVQRNTLVVTVCRGGRCGGDKHPDFDHPAQIAAVAAAVEARGAGSVRVGDCLAMCSASNVVVVRSGRTTRFLGRMADDRATAALCQWLEGGYPDLPAPLAAHLVDPASEFEEP